MESLMTDKDLEIFLSNDQPAASPLCGSRTEILSGFFKEEICSEIHICLTKDCRFQFIMEADTENPNYRSLITDH